MVSSCDTVVLALDYNLIMRNGRALELTLSVVRVVLACYFSVISIPSPIADR
jgi:hypothetical protein